MHLCSGTCCRLPSHLNRSSQIDIDGNLAQNRESDILLGHGAAVCFAVHEGHAVLSGLTVVSLAADTRRKHVSLKMPAVQLRLLVLPAHATKSGCYALSMMILPRHAYQR